MQDKYFPKQWHSIWEIIFYERGTHGLSSRVCCCRTIVRHLQSIMCVSAVPLGAAQHWVRSCFLLFIYFFYSCQQEQQVLFLAQHTCRPIWLVRQSCLSRELEIQKCPKCMFSDTNVSRGMLPLPFCQDFVCGNKLFFIITLTFENSVLC